MKAFEITRLTAVAMIACLPIACGSSSPTGPDVAALGADGIASALRSEPMPPTAPEAPSPEPVPVEGDPSDEVDPAPVPSDDDAGSIPAPDANTGRRPADVPETDPLPEDDAGSVPAPQPDGNAGSIPAPQPENIPGVTPPPAATPAPAAPPASVPPPQGNDGARGCRASAAEIMILRGSPPQPLHGSAVLLEMLMIDNNGDQIKDGSCQGVAWSFDVPRYAAGATITVGADTRYASVDGPAGVYVVRATTPNGRTATVEITLQ
jgi:hypothetical protein